MENKFKISVITTVLNNNRFIEETIESVANQTFDNYEYIIIDGGSTDGTIDIIKKYEDDIDYWVSERDEGIYQGMDKGILISKGEYFCILNSDDYFANNKVLQSVSNYINKYDFDFYYGNAVRIKRHSKEIIKTSESSISKLKYRNSIPHPALFIKKEDYIKLGGYNFSYSVSADYDFTLRMVVNGFKGKKMDLLIANTRKGGFSSKTNVQRKDHIKIKREAGVLNQFLIYTIYMLREITYHFKKMIKSILNSEL